MIAATAVTVTVGKKTAIAGGKGSFINTCTDSCTFYVSLSKHTHSKVCFFNCLCEASCVSSFLALSFFIPSAFLFKIWLFWTAFVGGIIANC